MQQAAGRPAVGCTQKYPKSLTSGSRKTQRRLEDETRRVRDGPRAAGMKHSLEARLECPPGCHLGFIAHFKDSLIVRGGRERRRRPEGEGQRIRALLGASNV